MDFLILLKPFLMDKTRTVGQKWLANELDLHFVTLKKCTKGQTIFSHSGGLRTGRFDEKRGGQIFHKSNTFSDENVKNKHIKILPKHKKIS